MTTIEFLREVFATILLILVPPAMLYLRGFLKAKLNLDENSLAANAINLAAERAGAVIYSKLMTEKLNQDSVAHGAVALEEITKASERVSESMTKLGVSRQQFTDMAFSELSRLLAANAGLLATTAGVVNKVNEKNNATDTTTTKTE